MHDEPINLQADHLAELDRKLDHRLTRALEATPELEIPADFAARVSARLPARRSSLHPIALTRTRYGRNATLTCTAILLVVLLTLASHQRSFSTVGLTIEGLLYAQFIILATWLGIRSLREAN